MMRKTDPDWGETPEEADRRRGITGWEVWKNGERVAELPAGSRSWSDDPEEVRRR